MHARYNLVIVIILVRGCTDSNGPPQPAAIDKPKVGEVKPMDRPLMEHPSGDFKSAVDAMADAIERLRELPEWDKWVAFSAQGMGGRVDSYHFAEIRLRKDELKFQNLLDVDIELVTKRAGVPQSCLTKSGEGYSVGKATPVQAARIMDAIYRQYFGIRPRTGEGEDCAIGAEWCR